MSALERHAREAWIRWGPYAKKTVCSRCGQFRDCRGHRRRFLCLDCFDQS